MKKILSLLLAFMLAFACFPGTASAAVGSSPSGPTAVPKLCVHSFVWVTVIPADCVNHGHDDHVCTKCGLADDERNTPPLGHDWKTVTSSEPDCINPGYRTQHCARCGVIGNNSEKIPALGHDWTWVNVKDKGCFSDGLRVERCRRCGAEGAQETIPAYGCHDYKFFRTTKEATCTENGTYENKCARCGWIHEYETDPLGHDWGDWYVAKEPSVGEPGYEERECRRCHIKETRPLEMMAGPGGDTVPPDEGPGPSSGEYTVTVGKVLTSVPANGSYFVEGEILDFVITVTNMANECYQSGTVYDDDDYAGFVLGTVEWFDPETSRTFAFSHTVTKDDCITGWYHNSARASLVNMDGAVKEYFSRIVNVKCGPDPVPFADSSLTVVKSFTGSYANGSFLQPGETASYEITVTNSGSVSLYDVETSDPLKGSFEDSILGIVPVLAPGESVVYHFDYEVTQSDADHGLITNQAYTRGWDGNDCGDVRTCSNIVEVPAGQQKHYDVYLYKDITSVPADEFYVEGENIRYSLSVWNDSDETILDLRLSDPMYPDGTVGICPALEPGAWWTVSFEHTVTESDIHNGLYATFSRPLGIFLSWLYNEASLTFTSGDGTAAVITADCDTAVGTRFGPEPDVPVYPDITISKERLNEPANGECFVSGEKIRYLITVANIGDIPVGSITVEDCLWTVSSSDCVTVGSGFSLEPHTIRSFTYSHTVTDQDAADGWVWNNASVNGVGENGISVGGTSGTVSSKTGYDPFGIEDPDPVTAELPYVRKTVVSEKTTGLKQDDPVIFAITVVNPAGRTFTDVTVHDILYDTGGHLIDTIPVLDAEPVTIYAEWSVTSLDVILTFITNTAWITLKDEYGDIHTVYSNEVTVYTGDDPVPPFLPGIPAIPGGSYCIPTLIGKDTSATAIGEEYCAKHAALRADVMKQFSEAGDDPAAKENAAIAAAALWRLAVIDEYTGLAAEFPEYAGALDADCTTFVHLLDTLDRLFIAQGRSRADVSGQLYLLAQERCCELCYAFHETETGRKDSLFNEAGTITVPASVGCDISYSGGAAAAVITESLCPVRHQPVARISARLMDAVAGKPDMLAPAMQRIFDYWLNELRGVYTGFEAALPAEDRVLSAAAGSAIESSVLTHTAVCNVLYASDPAVLYEVMTREIIRLLIHLCPD